MLFSYVESARQLEHETNLDVSKYDVCDNIDLDTILQEYEFVSQGISGHLIGLVVSFRSYFYIKFNRYPKLTKKNGSTGGKLVVFLFRMQNEKKWWSTVFQMALRLNHLRTCVCVCHYD